MKLVNCIKVWRAKKNVTQEKLATSINLSRQTINAIERGKFVPSVLTALKLAQFFHTTVEEIFYIRTEEKNEKISKS